MKITQGLNIFGFNVAWLGLVILGNDFIPVTLILLALHFKYLTTKAHEFAFIVVCGLIGISIDTTLSFIGVFIFADSLFIPLWLITLWLLFAATINHSLAFLSQHYAWQYLLGAIFGPLSYIAGANLGAVNLGYTIEKTFFILGLLWGPLLLLCFHLNHKISNLHQRLSNHHV